MNQNYYEILGVNKNATAEEIKAAYRDKAKQTHPDKENGNKEKFALVNQANQILSNPEKREYYDATGNDKVDDFSNLLAAYISECFTKYFQQEDFKKSNLVDFIKNTIISEIELLKENLENNSLLENKFTAILKRITAKKENFVLGIINAHINKCQELSEAAKKQIDFLEKALLAIDNYSYQTDPKDETDNYDPFSRFNIRRGKIQNQHKF